MNKIYIKLFALLFICTLISGSAEASTKTKYLTIGDINLVIEAPLGMCFVDQGSSSTVDIYKDMSNRLSDTKQKQIIAIFAPCHKLAEASGNLTADKLMDNFAYISWLYPSFAFHYEQGRSKFMEDIIKDSKTKGRGGFVKLDNSVATILKQSQKIDDKIVEDVILVGYTTLRNIPIEIKITNNIEYFETAETSYTLLNNFVNYQVKLNETN